MVQPKILQKIAVHIITNKPFTTKRMLNITISYENLHMPKIVYTYLVSYRKMLQIVKRRNELH